MVEIPDSLRSVFTATVRRRGDRYVVEVPAGEVDNETLALDEPYRVAVLDRVGSADGSASTRATASDPARRQTGAGGSQPHDEPAPAPPVDEGEVREVTIETVGDQGDGIAKVDRGYVVIVPGAEPGDEPTVEIEQVQQNVAFAKVVDQPHM
jgi:predicted RNA-binding protein with TRAM domain